VECTACSILSEFIRPWRLRQFVSSKRREQIYPVTRRHIPTKTDYSATCLLDVSHVCQPKETASSMFRRNLLVAAVHWTKTRGPPSKENRIGVIAACLPSRETDCVKSNTRWRIKNCPKIGPTRTNIKLFDISTGNFNISHLWVWL
jgi:hypothetical protein